MDEDHRLATPCKDRSHNFESYTSRVFSKLERTALGQLKWRRLLIFDRSVIFLVLELYSIYITGCVLVSYLGSHVKGSACLHLCHLILIHEEFIFKCDFILYALHLHVLGHMVPLDLHFDDKERKASVVCHHEVVAIQVETSHHVILLLGFAVPDCDLTEGLHWAMALGSCCKSFFKPFCLLGKELIL